MVSIWWITDHALIEPCACRMSSVAQRLIFAFVTIVILFGAVEAGLGLSGWPNVESAFEHNEPSGWWIRY